MTPAPKWTPVQDEYLLTNYRKSEDLPTIAGHLGRTMQACKIRLGLLSVSTGAAPVSPRPENAAPGRLLRSSSYDGKELEPYDGRPGANDALAMPSRVGDVRFFRDGRQEAA